MNDRLPAGAERALDETDRNYLQMAVELSCGYREDRRRWPFGAIVVVRGQVVGTGVNQVVELSDPAAHAEVMVLAADAQPGHVDDYVQRIEVVRRLGAEERRCLT